jgi:predicted nucleic acid-binding protein
VAGYFVDTSALAKLYHQEAGSEYVERVLSQPGSKGMVSRLTLVEMESVFAIKVRTGALEVQGQVIALRRLRADIARERLIVGLPVEETHYRSAARLLRDHGITRGLRTLDALQLAVALDMRRAAWISVVLSADQRLCAVAEICGCTAINPASPGLVQG